jgi:hypothetical protein
MQTPEDFNHGWTQMNTDRDRNADSKQISAKSESQRAPMLSFSDEKSVSIRVHPCLNSAYSGAQS